MAETPITLESIYENNPWWSPSDEGSWIKDDQEISVWEDSKVKWDPEVRHEFNLKKDLVYSLRGPRQVGKTTLFKLQVREMLAGGVLPHNIFYYNFDAVTSPADLIFIVRNYLNDTKKQRGATRSFLFLDEITSIRNWQKGIKYLVDIGKLRNCTIIVIGSHAIDLKYSSESMYGRRGITDDAYDKIIRPMKFSTFLITMDSGWKESLTKNGFLNASKRLSIFNKLQNGIIDDVFYDMKLNLYDLEKYLNKYMLIGGTPIIMNEYINTNQIQNSTYEIHMNQILRDIQSSIMNMSAMKQLIKNIIKVTPGGYALNSLRKNTAINTTETVENYIDLLERSFVLTVLYQYNIDTDKEMPARTKKLNFCDPFYYHSLNSITSTKKSFELALSILDDSRKRGHLIEGIIADHLNRFAYDMNQEQFFYEYSDSLFSWRYNGREVDFILRLKDRPLLPIELKYQNSLTSRDYDGLISFKKIAKTKNSILISKYDLESKRECAVIPAAMFLLLV